MITMPNLVVRPTWLTWGVLMGASVLTTLTPRDARTPPHWVRWTPDDRLLVSGAGQDETPTRTRKAVLVQNTRDGSSRFVALPVANG